MVGKIISTFFTRFFIAASNLIIAILLSHFIGAAGRGEQSLIITLVSFILIIAGIIGSASISYLVPRRPFITLIIPAYLWVLLVTVACFAFLPALNLIPAQYVTDVCLLSLMLSVLNIHTAVLVAHQRINAANLPGFIQSLVIVLMLVLYFAVLNDRSIRSYIVALYCGYGLALVVSTMMIRQYFKGSGRLSAGDWFLTTQKLALLGLYNQVALFTQLLSFRISYYILNAHFGSTEVGVYSNAVSIAESVWLIGRSIGTVQHSKIVNSTDKGESIRLTTRLNRINLAVSVLVIAVMACIPGSWYGFIFGREFTQINRIIWTLGPGIVCFGIVLVLGYYFSSTGRHLVNAISSTAGLAVTLLLGFIVIPRWGSYGAGVTASVSYGITAIVVAYFYWREKHGVKRV